MRAPIPFVFVPLLLLAALPAQRNRGERPQLQLEHFTVENATFASTKVRDGEAGYTILLPKGHADEANKERQWPWVLWLSGFGGSDEFQGGGGAAVLDKLRGEGKVPEMAFVIYRAPGGRGRSTYMNGERAADTEDLLVQDLPAHLAQKYRLSTDRKHRALMGVSAGGFGALKLALRHPDVFGVVAAHSAAILPEDPAQLVGMNEQIVGRFLRGGLEKELGNPIDKDKWAAHMPLAIVAKKKPEELQGLQVYFDAGTDDRYEFCPPNEELARRMTAAGHKHLFRKVEGGGHAFGSESMKDNVAHSLRFVGLAFAGKDAVAEMAPKADAKPADAKAGGGTKPGDGK